VKPGAAVDFSSIPLEASGSGITGASKPSAYNETQIGQRLYKIVLKYPAALLLG
jgi:hypothetical protein